MDTSMKKANVLKQLCALRCTERTRAMPLAACVHEVHTCALFSCTFVPESGMGTSMKKSTLATALRTCCEAAAWRLGDFKEKMDGYGSKL